MFKLTRRRVIPLFLVGALAPIAVLAKKKEPPEPQSQALAAKLQNELNTHLTCGGAFTVFEAEMGEVQGEQVILAKVRLDWPPGNRIRRFRATGGSKDEALQNFVKSSVDTFGKAWPGCVV